MFKTSLSILISCAILIGCGSNDTDTTSKSATPPPQSQQTTTAAAQQPALTEGAALMPLAVGNRWTYQMAMLDTLTGKMTLAGQSVYEVMRDTAMTGETWYFMSGMGPNGTWVTNRADGFWIISPTRQPMLLAKYPGQVGEEFTRITGPATIINRIAEVSVITPVGAGTYSCYKYAQEFGGPSRTSYNYYSPGVGMVKMEVMNETLSHAVMSSELVKAEWK